MYQFVKEQTPEQRREYIAERGTQRLAARSLHAQERMAEMQIGSHRKHSSKIDTFSQGAPSVNSSTLIAESVTTTSQFTPARRSSRQQPQLHEMLNEIVETCFENLNLLTELDHRKDYIVSFVDMLEELPAHVIGTVFTTIEARVCLCNPDK